MNIDKTKYMIVRHMKIQHEPELKMEHLKINMVHQYEYLGMTLDDKLSMNEYLDVISKKKLKNWYPLEGQTFYF